MDMRRFITPDRIANSIMMWGRSYRGAFLILEGDDDAKVFRNLIDNNSCRIEIANGKPNTVSVIRELNKRKARGILGIVDADYWLFEGSQPNTTNLISTDQPNLEIMLLLSPALGKVVTELLPSDKLEYIPRIVSTLRELLANTGKRIGCLRIFSLQQKLFLDFKDMPFKEFVDENNFEIDISKLVRVVTVTHKNLYFSREEIIEEINKLLTVHENSWHYCQGHDLVSLLEIILPEVIRKIAGRDAANYAIRRVRAENIGRNLRLAYEREYFKETELSDAIRSWESENISYRILP